MSVFHENLSKKYIFWPISVRKATSLAKAEAQNEPSTSRESEQVRETGEDYLAWFMNRSHVEPIDKIDELDDYLEKERSFLESLYMRHHLWIIIYES